MRINKQETIALGTVLFVALGTRLLGVATRPIWYDEAFSILFARKGPIATIFGTLGAVNATAAEEHPLAYYWMLWGWMRVFGESLAAVRLLSILAGTAIVAISYSLARELFNEKTAMVASVFVALTPFQVHYSQEIRMYSFLALWLILATYAYVRGAKGDGTKWWVIFAVSAGLAQYTHNLAAFYLIPLAAWPFFRRDWKTSRAVFFAGLGAVFLYLPWLIQLPAQFTKVSTSYWVEKPGADKFFTLLLMYVTNLPLPNATLLFIGLFIAMTAFAIAAWQTFKQTNRKVDAFWLLYLSFVPPLLLFSVSQWVPVYVERSLLPSGVIFCLWLAWALFDTTLPSLFRNGVLTLLALGAGMGLYQHVSYKGFPYAPFTEMDAAIRTQLQPGDVIIHSSKLSLLPAVYFDPTLPQIYIADPPGSSVDTLAPATQEILGVVAKQDIASAAESARRIWFVIFEKSIQEYVLSGKATHPHLAWLEKHYKLAETQEWNDLRVYLFIRPLSTAHAKP